MYVYSVSPKSSVMSLRLLALYSIINLNELQATSTLFAFFFSYCVNSRNPSSPVSTCRIEVTELLGETEYIKICSL